MYTLQQNRPEPPSLFRRLIFALTVFLSSWRKNRSLQNISRTLGSTTLPANLPDLMQGGDERAAAEDALYDLVEQDPQLAEIMRRFGATRDSLRRIFKALQLNGGQWVGRDYLPASSLACAPTLTFVLALQQEGQQVAWRVVVLRLVRYFENNEIGPVTP